MSYQKFNYNPFNINDLVLVPEIVNPVLLKSGGPIMSLLTLKEDQALCEWDDGRAWFNVACLYKLVKFNK